MAKEIITLNPDGSIQSEFQGFTGKSCFKAAQEIAEQLQTLGIKTDVTILKFKDDQPGHRVAEKITITEMEG